MIIETPEQHAIRLKNLEHVRNIRGLIIKDRSLARSAFERLTNNQRRYLLIASGINPHLSNWQHLTDSEVRAVQMGLKRLQIIINEFANCTDHDFSRSQHDLTPQIIKGINHDQTVNEVA